MLNLLTIMNSNIFLVALYKNQMLINLSFIFLSIIMLSFTNNFYFFIFYLFFKKLIKNLKRENVKYFDGN